MTMVKRWEHFTHGADIGIRGIGPTLTDAFEMGALALTNVVVDAALVNPIKIIQIACSAPNVEILFIDWLNALIYEMETRCMLFSEFHLTIRKLTLRAIIKGEKIDKLRHQPVVDIKGATYTELKVCPIKDGWIAQCVVDV